MVHKLTAESLDNFAPPTSTEYNKINDLIKINSSPKPPDLIINATSAIFGIFAGVEPNL